MKEAKAKVEAEAPAMTEAQVKAAATAFAALPKAQRRAQFDALDPKVKPLAKELVTTKNSGYRHINGRVEFTQEALAAQIERLTLKHAEMEGRRTNIAQKIADYQAEYAERFGADK